MQSMDVGAWLLGLGLAEYEAVFRENRIDFDILPRLTAEDLKEIGVAAVGDRRRILAAAEALLAPSAPARPAPASIELAERRQLLP